MQVTLSEADRKTLARVLGSIGGKKGSRADKVRAGRLGGLAKGRKGQQRKAA